MDEEQQRRFRLCFGPRKAFIASVADWWDNCARWHRHGGSRFL
jgi:hypothetical protein